MVRRDAQHRKSLDLYDTDAAVEDVPRMHRGHIVSVKMRCDAGCVRGWRAGSHQKACNLDTFLIPYANCFIYIQSIAFVPLVVACTLGVQERVFRLGRMSQELNNLAAFALTSQSSSTLHR